MITTALIILILEFVAYVISWLPNTPVLPPEIPTSIAYFIASVLPWEYYFPVSTGFHVLYLLLLWEFFVSVWYTGRFILRMIRGA